jgi:hypothetical protein
MEPSPTTGGLADVEPPRTQPVLIGILNQRSG